MANIVTTVGLERIAQAILNDINYAAVGTSNTPPAISDIKLGAETFRKPPDYSFRQGKKAQIRTQFNNANLPATTQELGWFMNATSAPDSGSLLVRATSTFAKDSQDLITILEFEIQSA